MPRRRFASCALLAALLVACGGQEAARPAAGGASAPAAAQAPTPVVFVYAAATAGAVPVWLAYEQGLYARYGLDVTLTPIVGTTAALAALISGQAQFVLVGADSLLPALVPNPDMVVVATLNRLLNWRIVARPEVRTAADLRGKRVGIGRYGDAPHVFAQQALERLGLDPNRDVAFLQIGEPGARVAALQSGAIDATLFPPPAYVPLVEQGYPVVTNLADLGMATAGLSVVTSRDFLEQRPAVVEALVKGLVHGIAVFKQDPAASKAALQKYTDTTSAAALEESYRAYADGEIIQRKPYSDYEIVQAALDRAAEEQPELRRVDVARVWDNSIVRRLDESGYIDALYRS
jgi:NitT/TauT family transport system substrate-binding protein